MKVLNDFKCPEGHEHEYFVDNLAKTVECKDCGSEASKVRAVPNFSLPGNDKAGFPTAHAAWERKRNQKMSEEKRLGLD